MHLWQFQFPYNEQVGILRILLFPLLFIRSKPYRFTSFISYDVGSDKSIGIFWLREFQDNRICRVHLHFKFLYWSRYCNRKVIQIRLVNQDTHKTIAFLALRLGLQTPKLCQDSWHSDVALNDIAPLARSPWNWCPLKCLIQARVTIIHILTRLTF